MRKYGIISKRITFLTTPFMIMVTRVSVVNLARVPLKKAKIHALAVGQDLPRRNVVSIRRFLHE
jgi:hypothetical protein